MGLYKQVDTVDARTYRYHRVAAMHVYTNRQVTLEIVSYVNQEARDAEKLAIANGTPHDTYAHTWYFAAPYDATFNVVSAYNLLKEQDMFENLENPMVGSADRFEGNDAQHYIESLADDLTVEELIAASEVVRVDAYGTADEVREAIYLSAQPWAPDSSYAVGNIRVHDGVPYKCVQAHTSQVGWEPPNAVSLWARVLAGGETIPVWEQPESTNPYMTGDRVHYPNAQDPIYVSTVDNNVWAPNVYGWVLEGGN